MVFKRRIENRNAVMQKREAVEGKGACRICQRFEKVSCGDGKFSCQPIKQWFCRGGKQQD